MRGKQGVLWCFALIEGGFLFFCYIRDVPHARQAAAFQSSPSNLTLM
jgi:hypothetical protein